MPFYALFNLCKLLYIIVPPAASWTLLDRGRGLGRGEAFCEGELFGAGWGVGMKKSRRDGSRWDLFERERGEDEKTKYAGKMLLPVHRGSGEPTSFMPIEYRKSRFLW